MVIFRDGKVYELTADEKLAAFEEVKAELREQEQKRTPSQKELDARFMRNGLGKCVARKYPYPHNFFIAEILSSLPSESIDAYINGNEEYREDRMAGLLLVIEALPQEYRLAIEYRYKDGKTYDNGAALMEIAPSRFRNLLKNSSRKIQKTPLFRVPLNYGIKETENRGLLKELREMAMGH